MLKVLLFNKKNLQHAGYLCVIDIVFFTIRGFLYGKRREETQKREEIQERWRRNFALERKGAEEYRKVTSTKKVQHLHAAPFASSFVLFAPLRLCARGNYNSLPFFASTSTLFFGSFQSTFLVGSIPLMYFSMLV